ncbi:MAG: Gfo/Idh/MocA family oxidoreductase [Lachnospiraceae bacterium]|nr:Gfo/Idh/MocA family oxidoreductase [Lachnospiraceae bacterium]
MKKVITYGSFDLFHEGHYRILERAKALGDYLIVGVTTEHYDETRGKLNLVDPIMTRIDNVRKTGFADEIIVEDHEGQKIEDIQKYGIDVFVLGSDWTGKFDQLKQYCEVVYLDRTPNVSSTMKRKKRFRITRIGIIGTGRIAPRFFEETSYVSGAEVSCAFNPERKSARDFSDRYQIRVESDSFQAFLDEVDAVFIASPNETHSDYARRSILAGKHVLCEKPMAFTYEETKELYALADKKHVVLMEGIRTAYLPGFQQILSVAKSGRIGEICDVEACFTRLADPASREATDARYGGAFLEFGGYTMLPIIKLLGEDYEELRIDPILRKDGLDIYTKVQFRYKNALATAKCGVAVKSEGQLVIAGTKGYLLAQSPWWLTSGFDVRYEDSTRIDHYETPFRGDGFRYEISDFMAQINGSGKNIYKLTAAESTAMARVVEQFMDRRRSEQGWR